jgi:hypothetical protein
MKRFPRLMAATLVMLITLSAPVVAQSPTKATGGGTGTFDGQTVGSHFGFGVVLLGGGVAQGHFECNMAGNAAFGGLHIMAVQGQVSQGSNAGGSVSFSGNGTLNMDGKDTPVIFAVTVSGGGPGVGTLQLTVTDLKGGVIAAFPPETVVSGGIKVN